MLMLMLILQASVDLFVLFFVLPCAHAYVACENQAIKFKGCVKKAFKLTLMLFELSINSIYKYCSYHTLLPKQNIN